MRKSMEETLEEIQKKKQQLIEREKLIRNKIANQDRKDRTRRLIQVGAIVESHLPVVSTFDAEALAKYFDKHPDTLAEVSQYILEKAPLIQAQREGENITRRNIRDHDSSDTTK
jgi:type I restriction-modification system DNA methylase subunit